jgi:hypothetical protein
LPPIEIRKKLTDEWKSRGLQEGVQFASLTDIIHKTWSDKTAQVVSPLNAKSVLSIEE